MARRSGLASPSTRSIRLVHGFRRTPTACCIVWRIAACRLTTRLVPRVDELFNGLEESTAPRRPPDRHDARTSRLANRRPRKSTQQRDDRPSKPVAEFAAEHCSTNRMPRQSAEIESVSRVYLSSQAVFSGAAQAQGPRVVAGRSAAATVQSLADKPRNDRDAIQSQIGSSVCDEFGYGMILRNNSTRWYLRAGGGLHDAGDRLTDDSAEARWRVVDAGGGQDDAIAYGLTSS